MDPKIFAVARKSIIRTIAGVETMQINDDGDLVITMSNGREFNLDLPAKDVDGGTYENWKKE